MSRTIEQMVLDVLDDPTGLRIIVDTKLPALLDGSIDVHKMIMDDVVEESLYYMIDRTSDCGQTVSDEWHITNSVGGGLVIPTNGWLVIFIENLLHRCKDAVVHTESY